MRVRSAATSAASSTGGGSEPAEVGLLTGGGTRCQRYQPLEVGREALGAGHLLFPAHKLLELRAAPAAAIVIDGHELGSPGRRSRSRGGAKRRQSSRGRIITGYRPGVAGPTRPRRIPQYHPRKTEDQMNLSAISSVWHRSCGGGYLKCAASQAIVASNTLSSSGVLDCQG